MWWHDDDDLARRMVANMEAFDIGDDELTLNGQKMLAWESGVEQPLIVADKAGGARRVVTKALDALKDTIIRNGLELVILDPLVEFHDLNELDNGDMRVVFGAFRKLAKETGCVILIIAHPRKLDSASSHGHIGNAESLRGASSQRDAVRGAATLFTPPLDDEKHWQFEGPRTDYVRFDFAKANFGKLVTEPAWFRREGIEIANGEIVGYLRPVKLVPKGLVEKKDLLEPLAAAVRSLGSGTWHRWSEVRGAIASQHHAAFEGQNAAEFVGGLMDNKDKAIVDGGMLLRKKVGEGTGARYSYRFEPDVSPRSP
jgi:AAA domain